MAQDYINIIPLDLLNMFFRKLNFGEKLIAMQTCAHWYEVLNEERYLRQRRFKLCPETIFSRGENNGVCLWNVEKMQCYHAFKISKEDISNERYEEFSQAVCTFLSREEVKRTVKHLYHSGVLARSQARLEFPQLNTIIETSPEIRNESDGSVVMNAPGLRELHLAYPQLSLSPMAKKFSDHIEKLNMKVSSAVIFFKTIDSGTFSNLRSLVLEAFDLNFTRETRFPVSSDHQRSVFGQLRYLKISDDYDIFYWLYEGLLKATNNLETLIIVGRQLRANAFYSIGNMKRLKNLCLHVDVYEYNSMTEYNALNGLSLPALEKMITTVIFPPLESAPQLKWLLIDFTFRKSDQMTDALERSLPKISQQLEALQLISVQMDTKIIELIQSFTNLKSLEMSQVKVHDVQLYEILRKLPTLRSLSIVWCSLMKIPEDNQQSQEMDDVESRNFFQKLKYDYPNKAIEGLDKSIECYNNNPEWECLVDHLE